MDDLVKPLSGVFLLKQAAVRGCHFGARFLRVLDPWSCDAAHLAATVRAELTHHTDGLHAHRLLVDH